MSEVIRDLEQRRVLVTGASRGIGRAIAVELGRRGAKLACVATSLEGLFGTMEELAQLGLDAENGGALAFACNVGDGEAIQQLVKDLGEQGFSPNVVVNNAGITRDSLLMRMTAEDFDTVLDVNLRGVFLLCKALARTLMKARDAAIINIGSVVGQLGNPGQANYAASKAGLLGFTKSLARELATRNVTCNVVAPGFIASDMTQALSEEQRQKILADVPLGRLGHCEEVASAVAFLAGPAGRYITGQVLTIDGGMAM
ncbi:MAG: 3-oxoacyl-[acyl-carrier-protein] reductase [Planctomycetota bacterium]|nr:MAG: 3-oxoacyl-[acyl-carrier-protein] reductase [Planctomycetota bacterium]